MIEAGLWGALGASGLLVGALAAFFLDVPRRVQGLVLAFGAGTLIGAVAYELFDEAVQAAIRSIDVALGFGLGAIGFYVGSIRIDRLSPVDLEGASKRDPRTTGLALVLGTVLDGLPESIVLGLSLLTGEGMGVAVLFAVFLSNVPEGLSASKDLSEGGLDRKRILALWALVVAASAVAAAVGFGVLGPLGPRTVVLMQSFAAGAILAMLAESMIPEAYEDGGRAVGLTTALGFAVAAAMSFG